MSSMEPVTTKERACRDALARCDVLRHEALVEETISPQDALEKMTVIIDQYMDEHEAGAW